MEQTTPPLEAGNNGDNGSVETPIAIGLTPRGARGRPPGSKNKNRAINLGGEEKPVSPRGPDPDAIESAKFIGAALVSLVELAETFVHNSCTAKMERKRPEKIGEFRQLAAKYQLQDKDKELISSSMEKIAARHDWMTRFAPEVVLCVSLGQYSMRQMALMRFVSAVTETKKGPEIPQGSQPIDKAKDVKL